MAVAFSATQEEIKTLKGSEFVAISLTTHFLSRSQVGQCLVQVQITRNGNNFVYYKTEIKQKDSLLALIFGVFTHKSIRQPLTLKSTEASAPHFIPPNQCIPLFPRNKNRLIPPFANYIKALTTKEQTTNESKMFSSISSGESTMEQFKDSFSLAWMGFQEERPLNDLAIIFFL